MLAYVPILVLGGIALAFALFSIGADTRLNHRFEITPGVLAGPSSALLRAFFAARR